MTTTVRNGQQPRSAARRGPARRTEDGWTAVLGAWLVAAVFSDGWAHSNVPDLEGFFTPWHGALYTALLANAAWIVWLGHARHSGWRLQRLPLGYGRGAIGVGVFALGGLTDLVWHELLGVEVGVDALLSPPHLVLLAGGVLILTSALRSRWAAGDRSSAVAQTALAAPTALVGFFLLYVSEFSAAAPAAAYVRLPESDPRHEAAELPALAGLGGFLVTTALLVVPLLLLWQRGRAPLGTVTAVVAPLAWLDAAVVGLPAAAVAGAAGGTAGAALADVLVSRLDRSTRLRDGVRLPALAAVVAGAVWVGHLAVLATTTTLTWPAELWGGVVVLSVMAAAALGFLAERPVATSR